MMILRRLFIIFFITSAAEAFVRITRLPVPGAVLGMVVLLVLMLTGILAPESVEQTGNFLLQNLSFLFVPLIVSARAQFPLLEIYGWKIAVMIIVPTLLVMTVTALTARLVLAMTDKGEGDE